MHSFKYKLKELYYRLASTERFSTWMLPAPAVSTSPSSPRGMLDVELVSHCWNYSHFLAYQLSSVILYEPKSIHLTMTICYSKQDRATVELLEFIEQQPVSNISWNFLPFDKKELFRRAIGRNRAALRTQADWIWFTDCDQVFHRGSLDSLSTLLEDRHEPLLFPRDVACTKLLRPDDESLQWAKSGLRLVEIDPSQFEVKRHSRAIGALQIVRGDIARQIGYCDQIPFYQQPVDHWSKCYEDRTFRRLIGSQGHPIDVPNLFRIEHLQKGRKQRAA